MKIFILFICLLLLTPVCNGRYDFNTSRYPVPDWHLFDCLTNDFVDVTLEEGEYVVAADEETGNYLVHSHKKPDNVDLRWGDIMIVYFTKPVVNF